MCTSRKGAKNLPISAQSLPAFSWAGLSAVFMAGWRVYPPFLWRTVFGGAPRASPWHHLVSPIRFANGVT